MSASGSWKLLGALVVALIVVGAVGWQQFAPRPMLPKVCSLHGKLFFDYNGNGRQDQGEPDMPDVVVALNGKNVTATNSTGWYVIDNLLKGSYEMRPFPPKNFRYMCESAAEFRTVHASYEILVTNDTRKDIGLMEGFLSLPFDSSIKSEIRIFYDHMRDDLPGVVNYLGDTTESIPKKPPPDIGTGKMHRGIDFGAPGGAESFRGTPVRAVAPGKLHYVGYVDGSLAIVINHGYNSELNELLSSRFMEVHTYYGHLDRLAQRIENATKSGNPILIKRGEIIGYAGSTGTSWPHLHFGVSYNERGGQSRYKKIDAFAVLPEIIEEYKDKLYDYEVAHINWWIVYNTPKYPAVPSEQLRITRFAKACLRGPWPHFREAIGHRILLTVKP